MFLQHKFKYLTLHLRGMATAAALLACAAAPAAHADTMTLLQYKGGWVSSTGAGNGAETGISNLYTGNDNGHRINSWATFYIPAGHYTSASLSFNPTFWGDNGPNKIGFFDVTHGPGSLIGGGMYPGVDVFNDLGSGVQYGSTTLFDSAGTARLNGNALYDINTNAGFYFTVGFSNLTLNALPVDTVGGIYLTKFGRQQVPMELHLTTAPVPEPDSWAMLLGGLGVVGCVAMRRQKQRS